MFWKYTTHVLDIAPSQKRVLQVLKTRFRHGRQAVVALEPLSGRESMLVLLLLSRLGQVLKNAQLSGSVEGGKSEFRIEPFHLGTRRVAEVVPHLGLQVRGPSRRHAL